MQGWYSRSSWMAEIGARTDPAAPSGAEGERGAPRMPPVQAPAASRLTLYLDLIRWDRPAGWLLLLWPSLSALWIAADGFPGWHLLLVFVLGTILMRSAGCCVNDVADRDFDKHVKRTAMRPVTRGALSVRRSAALRCGARAAGLRAGAEHQPGGHHAVVCRAGGGRDLSLCQALVAMPQAVLGVAFSFGIPMAFAAVLGGS